MESEKIKRLLREQIDRIHSLDFETWHGSTQSYINDYFQSFSQQSRNFSQIIGDYNLKKILGENTPEYMNTIRMRSVQVLNELIRYVDNNPKIETNLKTKAYTDANGAGQTVKKGVVSNKSQNNRLSVGTWIAIFGIPVGLLAIFVPLAYQIGHDNGGAKFDKEKSDYLNSVHTLKSDSIRYSQKIDSLIGITKQYKDSLKELNSRYIGLSIMYSELDKN